MSDVFISYSRNDVNFVVKLAREIELLGYSVWWDNSLIPGNDFHKIIERELNLAKCVIVVWSSSSRNSHWVKAESAIAMERNVCIPVTLDNTSPPIPFNQLQTCNLGFFDKKTNKLPENLIKGISDVVGFSSKVSPKGNIKNSKNTLWISSIVGLVLVGVISFLFILGKYKSIDTNTPHVSKEKIESNVFSPLESKIIKPPIISSDSKNKQELSFGNVDLKEEPFIKVSYDTEFSDNGKRVLYAMINGNKYEVQTAEDDFDCFNVTEQKDFDGNGTTDVLLSGDSMGCANSGPSFYSLITYHRNGKFNNLGYFGESFDSPSIENYKGKWSIVLNVTDEGVGNTSTSEQMQRYVVRNSKVEKVEVADSAKLISEIELVAENFISQRDGEEKNINFDVDNDGELDKIIGSFWSKWGTINWKILFSDKGKLNYESDISCKRLGILTSRSNGMNDLVCGLSNILKWDGNKYVRSQ